MNPIILHRLKLAAMAVVMAVPAMPVVSNLDDDLRIRRRNQRCEEQKGE
jgi:hypothetical protein